MIESKYFEKEPKIKCSKCQKEFLELEVELSHDIPKYLGGTDLDGRHWLCKKCHNEYDNLILRKCLEFLGEEFDEVERIVWMIELRNQSEQLKNKLKEIAFKVKGDYYGESI